MVERTLLRTYTSRMVDPFDLKPEDVDPLDIAHALAFQCRYGGHCWRHYSVAEHSILVALVALDTGGADAERQARLGLLHDADEAYLPDLPRPIKQRLPAYAEAGTRARAVVLGALGVETCAASEAAVHKIDQVLVGPEMDALWTPRRAVVGIIKSLEPEEAMHRWITLGESLGLWRGDVWMRQNLMERGTVAEASP